MKKRAVVSTLSKNTLYLLIGNLGGTGLAFVFSILIGRVLGEEGLGIYSAVLAWIFTLSMLVDFGITSLFTRDLAANPEHTSQYLQTAVRQRWLFAGLVMLILVFGVNFLSDSAAIRIGIVISAPLLLIEALFGLYTAIFRARQQMFPIALLNIGMLLVQVTLAALALWQGAGIEIILLINMLTSLLRLGLGCFYFSFFRSHATSDKSKIISVRRMLKLAMPFALAGLLAVAQQRLGIIMLEQLSSLEEVGRYAAVMRFIEAGRMIPNAFFGALFPALASLAVNQVAMNRFFLRVTLGLSAFAILGGIFGTIFAQSIIEVTYGSAFLASTTILQAAVWTLLPSLLIGARTLFHYANGRERFVNIITAVMLLVQFALSLWLIPLLGTLGLVIALLISSVIGLLLLR